MLKKAIITVGILLAIFIILNVGIVIGTRRASYMNLHSAFGQITRIDQGSVFVKDPDNVEKSIIIGTTTEITNKNNTVGVTDLHTDDFVIAIGSPNNACQLEAKTIQVVAPPPFYKSSN